MYSETASQPAKTAVVRSSGGAFHSWKNEPYDVTVIQP